MRMALDFGNTLLGVLPCSSDGAFDSVLLILMQAELPRSTAIMEAQWNVTSVVKD